MQKLNKVCCLSFYSFIRRSYLILDFCYSILNDKKDAENFGKIFGY